MSATFIIHDSPTCHSTWMPSSGKFERAIEYISKELALIDTALAGKLNELVTPGVYGDLRKMSPDEMSTLLLALNRAHQQLIANSNMENDFYDAPFFHAFSELKAIFAVDERLNIDYEVRTVFVNSESQWNAPEWAGDLVLEILASQHINHDKNLSQRLLDIRDNHDLVLNLDTLTVPELCSLLKYVGWLVIFYDVPDRGRCGVSNRMNPLLHHKMPELHKMILQDVRIAECAE